MKFLTIINKISIVGKYLAFFSEWIEATQLIASKHFSTDDNNKNKEKKEGDN